MFQNPDTLLINERTGKPFENIAVFRALQLGDLICSEPALRALRETLPEARITLIGLPWAREWVRAYEGAYGFLEFPGFPGMPEREFDPSGFVRFLEEARSRRFDLVIQMHGNGRITNHVVALIEAQAYAGYFMPGGFCPDPRRFLPYPEVTHEIWRHLEFMSFLGARPLHADAAEEPRFPVSRKALASLPSDLPEGKIVVLHPGARAGFRCWDTQGFAEVGDALAERGYQIVVTGTNGEKERVEHVISQMRSPVWNLAGKTDLAGMAALLSRSRLLICNDTGVSHLAVALQLSSVVVFTRSEFLGWPPLNRVRHRVVSRLEGPKPMDVLAEALDLLGSRGASEKLLAS